MSDTSAVSRKSVMVTNTPAEMTPSEKALACKKELDASFKSLGVQKFSKGILQGNIEIYNHRKKFEPAETERQTVAKSIKMVQSLDKSLTVLGYPGGKAPSTAELWDMNKFCGYTDNVFSRVASFQKKEGLIDPSSPTKNTLVGKTTIDKMDRALEAKIGK